MSFLKRIKDGVIPINRRAFKREMAKEIAQQNEHLNKRLETLYKKASMQDNIWQINDVRFFVPNYPLDLIQNIIVNTNKFYEQDILEDLSQYMPKEPVICDIGSNIGNHALYWLSQQDAKFVYCFEPRLETFNILQKNIEINKFNERAKCFNIALSDKKSNLSTNSFECQNIGANNYKEDATGNTAAVPLDDLNIPEKIDFIKIDVEGMEYGVLKGAEKTIRRDSPVIFIEIFSLNYEKTHSLLTEMQYKMVKKCSDANYLFMPLKKSQTENKY